MKKEQITIEDLVEAINLLGMKYKLATEEIDLLNTQLKTLRNSTIDECLKECDRVRDDGLFFPKFVEDRLNALKND